MEKFSFLMTALTIIYYDCTFQNLLFISYDYDYDNDSVVHTLCSLWLWLYNYDYDYDAVWTTQGLRRKLRPRANVELMSILIHSHTTISIVILHWNARAREHAHLFVFSRLSAYTCNGEYKYCSRRAVLWNALLQNRKQRTAIHAALSRRRYSCKPCY